MATTRAKAEADKRHDSCIHCFRLHCIATAVLPIPCGGMDGRVVIIGNAP